MALQTSELYYKQECVECVTCGNQIMFGVDACSKCETPLDVSRSVAMRGTPLHFVSVLGPSGAGKTVYLGMLLDILSQGKGELRGIPNGAFSVAVQQQTISALEKQRFPEKTPTESDRWRWVHCEVSHQKKNRHNVDLITPDLAGESIAAELEQPRSYPTVRHAMKNSKGLIFLFDSESVRDKGRTEDLFGIKLASYLASLKQTDAKSQHSKITAPIAIVFTKADCCLEALDNPTAFAEANMPGMLRLCEKKYAHFEFFAASVVGSSITDFGDHGMPIQIPLHVEPKGVIEPLEWLLQFSQ
jgi:hypothetical protein